MPTLQEIKKRQQYITKANQVEEKYGLPKNLLVGVMGAESNFNPNAVSPVGAKGLMQFMKATAQEYGINPLNPSESIDAAGKYLASSYKKFGNWEDSLRSYNMGVGGLQKVKAGKKALPKETQDYVGRVYKHAGIKYDEPSYANSVAPYMNQQKETVIPNINYFDIPTQTTTFASVPDSAEKEDKTEKIDKDLEEVETKTKEYNFLEELQKEDYSHLQPEQVAQQQTLPQVDFNQQYEQVSQFIDNPVAQQGLTWQERLANRPKKPTVAEIIAEGDARKAQQRTQADNTKISNYNDARLFNPNARNKTDKEIAQEREAKIQASVEAQKTPFTKENWRQQLAAETVATGDKLRVNLEPNFFDDYLNPAVMIGSMASNLGQAPLQAQQSDSVMPYVTSIGAPLTVGALAGLGTQNTGQFVNNLANPLAGTGDLVNNLGNKYLPNAYKLNPNAFKPNPNNFYRQVDNTTYNEGLESGLIRGKQDIGHSGVEGINLNKSFGDDAYYNKGNLYYKNNKDLPYLFEANLPEDKFIPKVNGRTRKYTTENTSVRVSKEPLPINDPNITTYKKDWLQGYKQVEVPKPTSNFKSEINWGQWNKEIPDNPQLMQEYNAIEQTSKANGSWMKNPDGSAFQGTPEQFVQQNSENFKKAFGNSKLINTDGSTEINYHSTYNDLFDTFDINKFDSSTNDGGWYGKGFYTSPNEKWANRFGDKTLTGYLNIENPVPNNLEVFFGRKGYGSTPELGKFNIEEKLKNYDGVITSPNNTDVERVFNNPSNFKSAIGNNGMFDMTNPNIYKSIAPIAGASYLATQGQEEPKKLQQGGEFTENELAFLSEIAIKDNNGYWNKNNQDKVVEIEGNKITMEGVDQDLIGISKQTGEKKLMKPNKNYTFGKKTKNVIEIPFFKK